MFKNKKNILLCCCAFLCFTVSAARFRTSDYVITSWTIDDGLPGNEINELLQSCDGYIYIGTYEGLVRFNGIDFTVLSRGNAGGVGLISARSIFQSSDGKIWVGSNDEGLESFGSEKILLTVKESLPSNSIRALAEDFNHNLWIGTAGGIVFYSPDGSIHKPEFAEPDDEESKKAESGIVENLFCDTSGRIWFTTAGVKSIFVYQNGKFSRYTRLDGAGNFTVSAMGQDSDGNFWFGLGKDGVYKVSADVVEKVETKTKLDSIPSRKIYCDSNGLIWFGLDEGLAVYKDGVFMEVYDSSIGEDSINAILEDREGNIWLGTNHSGIRKISGGKFQTVNLNTTVNAIAETSGGDVYLAANDGLHLVKNGLTSEDSLTDYVAGKRIRDVSESSDGEILVSCYSVPGFVVYGTDGKIRNWTSEDGISGNKIRVARKMKNGSYYVGTTTGLSIIKTDCSIMQIGQKDGLECEYIMSIMQDSDGIVWIGTDGGGIFIMKDDKVAAHFTTAKGLSGNVVFKTVQDISGNFWICTGTGVTFITIDSLRKKQPVFKCLNSLNGFACDSVFQIVFDFTGNAWITSNKGISSVLISELMNVVDGKKQKFDVKNYNKTDGLKSSGITSTSLSMLDNLGRIWFTMTDGFAIYDPLKIKTQNVTPLINLESVKYGDEEYFDFSKPIVLPAGTKRVDFQYSGLNFSAPERIRYKYMLENFDSGFSDKISSREVSYTGLNPGKYVFKVYSFSADGIQSTDCASVTIVQEPFIYQRVEFWIIIAVLCITVFLVVFLLRERAKKIRILQLETMVNMKTVDLEIEKDRSEHLLRTILPNSIAEELKDNIHVIGNSYKDTAILFLDIVNFTNTTAAHTAEEIVNALNDLFSLFDERAADENSHIEKIKTIGDAYMAACGVPDVQEKPEIFMIDFAKGLYEDLEKYNKTAKIKFKARIGINCGPVVAGVIGKTKFVYDIWGDTVNVASRMESLCQPGKICVTEEVYSRIKNLDDIEVCGSEKVEVKGKGLMTVYQIER